MQRPLKNSYAEKAEVKFHLSFYCGICRDSTQGRAVETLTLPAEKEQERDIYKQKIDSFALWVHNAFVIQNKNDMTLCVIV